MLQAFRHPADSGTLTPPSTILTRVDRKVRLS
jgi:hypothetical protein